MEDPMNGYWEWSKRWQSALGDKPVRGKHWGVYDLGTSMDRYRYCYACKSWRRNPMLRDSKPLIHKGGKP